MKSSSSTFDNRWWVVSLFVLSTAINYLDRQTLATLAPVLRDEFRLNYTELGWITAAFSLTYAIAAPFAGMTIDRLGLTRGVCLAISLWSVAGILTGFTRGIAGLIACRALLGLAEAGGIPAAGKAIHAYLRPAERALGNGLNQAGVSLGLVLATPVATWIAIRQGWRAAFVLTGVIGLLWIPLWMATARRHPPPEPPVARAGAWWLLRMRRAWVFIAANALAMVVYSLWTNLLNLYLVDVAHVAFEKVAWYAWAPPAGALAGGFGGGWLSLWLIRQGARPLDSRKQVCFGAGLLSLVAAALPLTAGPIGATGLIALAMFAVSAFSVNMYSMPLDAFGEHAAFAVSLLVGSYGAVQAIVSPLFGRLIDLYGYGPVSVAAAFAPIAAWGVLMLDRE